MGTAYTRQSSFSDGDTITAALFNDEYNQLLTAFSYASSSTTGHQHDGTAGEGGNVHTIGDQDFLNKIVADSTNNRWGVFVEVSSAAVEQIRISDGVISPVTDNDIDLGTSSLEFKDAYFDGTITTDGLTVSSTTNLDGAIQVDNTITVGVDDTGYDVKFFGDTASAYMLWDTSTDDLVLAGAAGIDLAGDIDVDGTANLDVVDIDGAVDMASTLTLAGNADFNGDLDVDGTTNLDAVDIDGAVQIDGTVTVGVDDTGKDVKFFGATSGSYLLWDESADSLLLTDSTPVKIGDSQDMTLYHDGSNSYLTNAVGALKIATETSGIVITIGHTTSETTVADNLTVTGNASIGGDLDVTGSFDMSDANITNLGSIALDTITNDGTDITLDSSGDIILDAGGADVRLKDDGTQFGRFFNSSSNLVVASSISDEDILFQGSDGGSIITALTLDMSEAGAATFNNAITSGAVITSGAGLVIADAGNIGSASDTNAIGISSGGVVSITATTANTSATDGALTVAGGLGVALDASIGDDLRLISDSAVLSFGADSDVTLTHIADSGLTLSAGANATQLTINSTEGGASTAPVIALQRLSGSPADSDLIGELSWNAYNDAAENTTFAQVYGTALDVTDATEDGNLVFRAKTNGSMVSSLTLDGATASFINDVKLASDSAVLGFGADNDVTLTHVADTGLLLNSTMALQFNDSSQYINAPSATVLDINATDEIELNATLADVNANLDVSGTYTGGGLMTTGGNIVIPDAGNIGSASDTDAIAISSGGVVTMNQIPVFSAGINVSGGTIAGTLATAAQGNVTSLGTLTALTIDDVAVDGKVITMTGSSSDTAVFTAGTNGTLSIVTTDAAAAAANITITADGTFEADGTTITLDSAGDIILDAGGADIRLKDDGTQFGRFANSSSNLVVASSISDQDLLLQGSDGGSIITALTLDMSEAGAATFNSTITSGAGLVIADAGNIGSASDTDAIAISSAGVVALSATTEASATGTAALTVAGGIGVAKDMWIGDDIVMDSDSAVLKFGADQDVTLTHVADTGLALKSVATGDDKPIVFTLQTGETALVADEVVGAIRFQAPDEAGGTDAILVCAGVEAVAEATFTASVNETSLVFKTGASEAAAEKARITSEGYLRLAGKGIQFNADTADANSLDDYEEGTATITLTGTTAPPTSAITATASYVKVGKMVTIDVIFNAVSMSGSAGNVRLTGLPFAAASIGVAPSMQHGVGVGNSADASVIGGYNIWYINSTQMDLYTIANDTGWAAEAVNASTVYHYVSATYRTS